ncbi:TIGR04540 family protein [Clostridium botulinum C/D]|uniref:TIGR04540 family protein n=2 Tax=Clostridium botulinum TaxID=1491 RepID=UPI00036A5053|nr:TIGR04540 family protein [Clostridium botulinum]MCD3204035.1 TIGR04540 family protein [Clostridium botulinum C/D]KLU74577.1 hypothetical protein CBC3_13670 [Clostridium botulinum V891]KOA73252.1 hypothetical protein ADU78_12990 [Clostridium botulinum]KOA91180.1 hypothetical protein ADU76_11785 [Clostridium botulinum]MCD3223908.1 TIGR04540 family protein [Clostridium botulinum C/D]
MKISIKAGEKMPYNNIRLYYKNQSDLGFALRGYIDAYFEDRIHDAELEEKITSVVEANKDKFYKGDSIAQKPKQILGKTRLNLLKQILSKRGVNTSEKDSRTK